LFILCVDIFFTSIEQMASQPNSKAVGIFKKYRQPTIPEEEAKDPNFGIKGFVTKAPEGTLKPTATKILSPDEQARLTIKALRGGRTRRRHRRHRKIRRTRK